MKTILIPTDFSDCAANAIKYAADMAHFLKQEVHLVLLHVVNAQGVMIGSPAAVNMYGTPMEIIRPGYPMEGMIAGQAEQNKMAESRMKTLVEAHSNHSPLVRCSGLVRPGFFLDEVKNALKEVQADLVVMGTCGEGSFFDSVFASNTYSVIEENWKDVLVVPDGLTFRPFNTLVFAADLDKNNVNEIRSALTWAKPTSARVLVTHIENYDTEEIAESELMSRLWSHVKKGIDYPNLDYITVLANSIEEGIKKTLDRNEVDMLVMCPRQYSFLGGLFHTSHTREMIEQANTVVLCLATTNS